MLVCIMYVRAYNIIFIKQVLKEYDVSDVRLINASNDVRKYLIICLNTSACIHGSIFARSRIFGHYCDIMLFNAREIG